MPSQCQHCCVQCLIKDEPFLPLLALWKGYKEPGYRGPTICKLCACLFACVCAWPREMHARRHFAVKRKKWSICAFCAQLLYLNRKLATKIEPLNQIYSSFHRTYNSASISNIHLHLHLLHCQFHAMCILWIVRKSMGTDEFHLSFFFILLHIPRIVKEKKHFAQKSQLGSIKYGFSGTEARARTHTQCCLFNVSSKPSANSIYTDKPLSQIDYLLHTIPSFTVKLWHGATSSHCFVVH